MAKQVIVVRKDLNMRKGKIAAQASHSSLKVILDMMRQKDGRLFYLEVSKGSMMDEWLNGSFAKICVGVDSEQELMEIYGRAKASCLPVSLIIDSGKTEFHGVPTKTCIAIGPAREEDIDKITGHLKLL